MIHRNIFMAGALSLALAAPVALAADTAGLPAKKQTELGLYVDSKEAYEIMQRQGRQTLFIDVRTRAEINFLGMPTVADANIPYMTMNEWFLWNEKKDQFRLELNQEFVPAVRQRLAAKGLDDDARIIVMCRSGSRSSKAANLLAKSGFTNVYTVIDGYEGDKAKTGMQKGQRVVNGWKNNGLPWTYKLAKEKMYLAGGGM